MGGISLRPVTGENWRDALQLEVHPEQRRFVAAYEPVAAIALSKAFLRLGGMEWTPYAVYEDATMAGFLALAGSPQEPEALWIHHFFIDRAHQGRGLGRAALEALIVHVRSGHPDCQALMLVVHPENLVARRLYEGCGFHATGETRWGEPVYRRAWDSA